MTVRVEQRREDTSPTERSPAEACAVCHLLGISSGAVHSGKWSPGQNPPSHNPPRPSPVFAHSISAINPPPPHTHTPIPIPSFPPLPLFFIRLVKISWREYPTVARHKI